MNNLVWNSDDIQRAATNWHYFCESCDPSASVQKSDWETMGVEGVKQHLVKRGMLVPTQE